VEGIGDGRIESEIPGEFPEQMENVKMDKLEDFQGFQNGGGRHARNVRA
jgi:hypothetical protein